MSNSSTGTNQVALRREAFLERLASALDERKMSQNELSRELQKYGLKASPGTVNGWLHYRRMPGGDYMLVLPQVLRVSGHWLLTDRGPKDPPGVHTEAQNVVAQVVRFAGDLARRYAVDGLSPGPQSDEARREMARDAVRQLEQALGLAEEEPRQSQVP